MLALWTAFALAPFTLWNIEWLSPRYVYMAAIPYSICLAWLIDAAIRALGQSKRIQLAVAGGVVMAALGAGAVSAEMTLDRNDEWARTTEPFRVLAEGLPAAVPDAPENARFVIYYGIWRDYPLWPRVVVRTIYKDETIDFINVERRNVDSTLPRRDPKDIVLFYSNGRFLPIAPTASK